MNNGRLKGYRKAITTISSQHFARLLRLGSDSRAETNRVSEQLLRLAERIPKLTQNIEARYEKSGSMLERLSEASHKLISESESLLRLAVGQSESDLVINGTSRLLKASLDYLDTWRNDVLARLSELQSSSDVLSRLQGSEAILQSLIFPLNHTQTMLRIEAARLPEQVRQVFAALTNEIAVVHAEVRDTFGKQFQILGTTIKTLERITADIENQARRVELELQERKSQIASSLERLRQELEKNSERDIELTSTGKAVASAIGSIVVALQTHDIASQRLEHVRQGLEEARTLMSESVARKESEKPLERAYSLMTVQRAQLEGVHSQVETSEDALRAGVREIRGKVTALDSECLMLKEFEEVTAAANGSVQVSFDLMLDVRTLLAGVIASSHDFHESIEPIGNLTTKLTGALEGLANKMKLIALNAQVQAVQIGSGTGLEVLAAHIADVSNRTSEFAESISVDITLLVSTIQDLTVSFKQISERGEEHLSKLEVDGSEHESVLHGIRDRALSKLNLVGEAVDEIRICTEGIDEQSDARNGALVPIVELMSSLTLLAADLKKLIHRTDIQIAAELAQNRYSLASEREAHARALKASGVTESLEAGGRAGDEASGGNSESECLVELF